MSVEDAKKLFPAATLVEDRPVDQTREEVLMDRRFRGASPKRALLYVSRKVYGGDVVYLYFDGTEELVGIAYSASSGRQLREEDLRF